MELMTKNEMQEIVDANYRRIKAAFEGRELSDHVLVFSDTILGSYGDPKRLLKLTSHITGVPWLLSVIPRDLCEDFFENVVGEFPTFDPMTFPVAFIAEERYGFCFFKMELIGKKDVGDN